ncbi:MAG: YdeI/OmpD-associated family protein [Pseudomonadota bacterium]
MDYFPYSFLGEIALHGVGVARVLTYHVLFLPGSLMHELPFDRYPRLRVEGEVADIPVRGAWMPVGDGRRYFIVSPEVRAGADVELGDRVTMRFRVDDQDYVEVPPALATALQHDADLGTIWAALSSGKKRMFAHHVAGAKTAPTQERRVADAAEALRLGITLRDLATRRKRGG